MDIKFVERKFSASPALVEYAEKKCKKLEKFFDREAFANITFYEEKNKDIVEITVQHAGMFFRAQEKTEDMYASVDGAVESIIRQIRKNKTRLEKRLRAGAFDAAEPEAEEGDYELIRVKTLNVKPMSVEDAILQMNLLNHEFFFFLNSDEGGAHCVVYKRDNGGYGLLISDK